MNLSSSIQYTKNFAKNPYFDPNPVWLFNVLRFWCVIGFILTVNTIYIILNCSPRKKSKTFRYLLVYHLIVGLGWEFSMTVLSPPLLMLPFTAMEAPGLLTFLGVSISIQIMLLATLGVATISAVCPLFYYRMNLILPPAHFLNKEIFRYLMYTLTYCVFYFLLAPLFYLAINYEDQTIVKLEYELEFNMTFDNLWSKNIAAFSFGDNPYALALVLVVGTLSFFCVIILTVCSTVIYTTVRSQTSNLSIATKKHHIILLKSLISMILVTSCQVVLVVPASMTLIMTHSLRADIFNIIVAGIGGVYPAAIIVYIMNYPPYRELYVKKFRVFKGFLLRKKAVAPKSGKTMSRAGLSYTVHSKSNFK